MRKNVALCLTVEYMDIMVCQVDDFYPVAGSINDYRGG